MKSVIFIVVCLCMSLLAHAFMDFGLGAPVEMFGIVWWVITVVSGVIAWFASEEFGK